MRNRIGFLGLLGLLGLLGYFTNNPGFYGFFGFFGLFTFFRIKPDEMFRFNVNKAAKNAFFSGVIIYPIVMIAGVRTSFSTAYAYGFVVSFTMQIIVFIFSLNWYERKGE